MRQFKVFKHPDGALESIRPGWSWTAFGLGCFWALALKMWGVGLAGLASLVLAGLLVPLELVGALIFSGVLLLIHLVFGLLGNRWHMQHLLDSGYRHADTVAAADAERALADASAALAKARIDAGIPRQHLSALDYDRYQGELQRAEREESLKREEAQAANAAVTRKRNDAAL